jgi:hypothetical protein
MPIFSKPSSGARTSVIYITVGSLTEVWSGIWFWYLRSNYPSTETGFYWCYGFLFTGLTLIVIGLAIGRIGWLGGDAHQAQLHRDELHDAEVKPAVTRVEQTPAAKGPSVVAANPGEIPAVVPNSRSHSNVNSEIRMK